MAARVGMSWSPAEACVGAPNTDAYCCWRSRCSATSVAERGGGGARGTVAQLVSSSHRSRSSSGSEVAHTLSASPLLSWPPSMSESSSSSAVAAAAGAGADAGTWLWRAVDAQACDMPAVGSPKAKAGAAELVAVVRPLPGAAEKGVAAEPLALPCGAGAGAWAPTPAEPPPMGAW